MCMAAPELSRTAFARTSTITQDSLTISQWVFEVVMLAQVATDNHKRQEFDSFKPVLANDTVMAFCHLYWSSSIAPSIPFPTPPVFPLIGSFPKSWWNPEIGLTNEPIIPICTYAFDLACLPNPYLVGGEGSLTSPWLPDFYDKNMEELLIFRAVPSSTTSSPSTSTTMATTTSSHTEQATESPVELPGPINNKVNCYGKGEKTEHVRMENAASSFCKSISKSSLKGKMVISHEYPFEWNGGFGTVTYKVSLEILEDSCIFVYDEKTCKKYLSVPTDSCDCGGINDKHGGKVSSSCLEWRIDPNLSA